MNGTSVSSAGVFRIKSINQKPYGAGSLTAAAKHNKREISDRETSFDSDRSHLNFALFDVPPTAEGVVELADRLMAKRGYRPKRTDATIAAEGLFSLDRADAVPNMRQFFEHCATWFSNDLRGDLLSADVHLDEDHPHVHVLVLLPLVEKGPAGSDLIGFTQTTKRRQHDFHQQVASMYGLRPPTPSLTRPQRQVLARSVHQAIAATGDPVRESRIYPAVARWIDRDPLVAAVEFGISIPSRHSLDVLAQTSGKGSTRTTDTQLGVACGRGSGQGALIEMPPSRQHPCSVGVASLMSSDLLDSMRRSPVIGPTEHVALTRERELDYPAEAWDAEAGEFRVPPPAARRERAAAKAQVAALLRDLEHRRDARAAN